MANGGVGELATGGHIGDGIITPEAVVLELETAGVSSRLFSGIIDALVQAALLLLLVLLAFFGASVATDGVTDQVGQTIAVVSLFLVIFVYPLVAEMLMRGRTVGKAAVGLRVVTIEGAPVRFRHAALRSMGGIVDKLIVPGGLIGLLFVLGTPSRQRIGDLLAGTIVIRDPNRTALPAGIWFPVPYGYELYAATIDPTAFTDAQYTVVRAFLMRVREFTPVARASVALELATRVEQTLRHQRPSQVQPEAFLLCVIARYQRRAFPDYQPAAWQGWRNGAQRVS